jgi:hypothetical protein
MQQRSALRSLPCAIGPDTQPTWIGIYATLDVFLLVASRNPNQHLGLISLFIWSSIDHGVVMAVQSVHNPIHVHHLYGDVPALIVIAAVLAFLSSQAFRLPFTKRAA